MISTNEANDLLTNGGHVVDSNQDKIGSISQVFLDDTTGEPAWVTVKTGMFGGAESFVPLAQSRLAGDDVAVPYDKAMVKDAPRVQDSDGHLSVEEEADLYRYYGIEGYADHGTAQVSTDAGEDRSTENYTDRSGTTPAGQDTSRPETDSAMTRSEERLEVGTETETVGKARLRKYIVTENVTKTVPVSHEEVRIEREPITDANRGDATAGGDITEEEHVVELKGERVVVEKETVPVERVQMGTETVTEDREVTEKVRKEQIEADTDQTGTPRSAERDA